MPDGYTEASQPVLGPNAADLFFRRKLATRRGFFRGGNRGPLFISQSYGRRVIGAGELKNRPGNIILRVGWKAPGDLDCLIQQLGHSRNTPFHAPDESEFCTRTSVGVAPKWRRKARLK